MLIPALEVGGTHVGAGLVDAATWALAGDGVRLELDAAADADVVLGIIARAASSIGAPPGSAWGVGMPDPFDYDTGFGRFHSVGKFEALNGVDVRAGLLARVTPEPARFAFVNDAEAFLLGEWAARGAPPIGRWAGVTLGTGVGSASLIDGRLVNAGGHIPPGGRAHRLTVDGRPLEDVMSRRALMSAFASASGQTLDVREVSARARGGDDVARAVIETALAALGAALAPWLSEFDTLVIGGSMTRSWDVLGPAFTAALNAHGARPAIIVAADVDSAALIGAARFAAN